MSALPDDLVITSSWPTRPTDERCTPRWLFDALDAEFHFLLDAAATESNTLVRAYCGLDGGVGCHGNGLHVDWAEACRFLADRPDRPPTVWLNCPYSRGAILRWCAKAEAEADRGVTTVLLLPADTSTTAFHRYALRHEHRFLKSRVSFDGAPRDAKGRLAPAKFGSVIVTMRPSHRLWSWG